MRYDRVEECKGGIEQGGDPFHALCDDCGGTYKIRTPVTLPEILVENGAVEMWAVYSEGSPLLLARTEDLAWELATQLFQDNKASLLELDYTCEQISVIPQQKEEQ